jgi:hypothetical protein
VNVLVYDRVHDLNNGVVVFDEDAAFVIPREIPSPILFASIVI